LYEQQGTPLILRDGNGALYPLAKDCLEGIRDPLWLDLPPLISLGMGIQTVQSSSSSATKNKIAVIALALEVIFDSVLQDILSVLIAIEFILHARVE
jgi:hypothetical protein